MKRNQFRKWVINCALGELLGIGAAGCIAVAVNYYLGEPQSWIQKIFVLFTMLVAGTIEGTSIAVFQWSVLRQLFPGMKLLAWWKWTVAIALLGWGLGMLPSLFFTQPSSTTVTETTEPSMWLITIMAVGSGAVAGALFALFQSFELKKHSSKWKWWIVANTLAWSVAMLIIFIGATWPSANTPIILIILSAIISGCLAGLSLGVITGVFLFKQVLPNEKKAKLTEHAAI
jgi:predicted membrane protein